MSSERRDAREVIEHSKGSRLRRKVYEREILRLQEELVQMT